MHHSTISPTRGRGHLLLVSCLLLPIACSDSEEEASAADAPAAPLLGVVELPISLRADDPAPGDAHDVQISPSKVQVNGANIGDVTGGKLADGVAAKLKQALAAPARTKAGLQVHSQVPYATTIGVLATLRDAGVTGVSVKVRKPGGSETGWLSLGGFSIGPKSGPEQEVSIPGAASHSWADFGAAWDAVYGACGGSDSGNCAYKPAKIAEGGQLKMELFAAGQGVNVNFYRTGAPAPDPADKQADEPKKKAGPTDPVADVEEAPPATQALFQFRAKEAVKTPSAISATTAPLCGKSACGAVVRAEANTMTVRIVSLLGAAFPDGAAPPVLHFEQP